MRREDHPLQRPEKAREVRRVPGGGRLRGAAPGKLRGDEVEPALGADVLLVQPRVDALSEFWGSRQEGVCSARKNGAEQGNG